MTGEVVYRVTTVKGGVASIEVTSGALGFSGFDGAAGGAPGSASAPFPQVHLTVRPDGSSVADGPGVMGLAGGMGELAMMVSNKRMGIGDVLRSTKSVVLMAHGPTKVSASATFEGLKTVRGRRCATFGIMTRSAGLPSLRGRGSLALSAADGTLVALRMKHVYGVSIRDMSGTATHVVEYARSTARSGFGTPTPTSTPSSSMRQEGERRCWIRRGSRGCVSTIRSDG
jgi:hypothetical protein